KVLSNSSPSSLELFSSGRRCCRHRRDRPWVPSSSEEALLSPLRIVPPLLAVA
ncbi:hypothetical protein HN51_008800, partial [Arachis hypogaea]